MNFQLKQIGSLLHSKKILTNMLSLEVNHTGIFLCYDVLNVAKIFNSIIIINSNKTRTHQTLINYIQISDEEKSKHVILKNYK